VNPNHLRLLKKAQALDRSGNSLKASIAYREFLNREPKHSNAWADFAGQLLTLGKLDEAQNACVTALEQDPQHLSARINLGVILMRRERLEEAESHLRSVLQVDAHRLDAQLFLAECLLNKKDWGNARKILEEANQPGALSGRYSGLRSHHAQLWAILGLALLEVQQFGKAEEACNAALQIDPHNLRAKANLGSIQMALGHLDGAEGLFRRLVAEHPHEELARLLLITCLARKGNLDTADQEIGKVIQQKPDNFIVHMAVAGTYYSFGRWADYSAEIERFRTVDPTLAYLDFEQSFVDLLFGDMRQGWERYEARLRVPKELKPKRTFSQPTWNGEPFAGKTLLLWAEQGFGDTLMFLRYLPLVKALGGKVILEAQPALVEVAATCPGADLIISKDAPLPPFDQQASLMSLPWLFRTELASVPAQIPYLDIPEEVPHRQALQELLAMAQESTRVGLVWAGSPGHKRDVERSVPAASLAPLAALPGVAWFSFQLGRPEVPPLPNLISLAPMLKNFSDTAYALSGMDLVITVDTSVAHLAGALGIPTLLLLSFQPDFRWMLDRDDSPWYPTMRLYRQPAYGDWSAVIRRVVADLTQA